MSARENRHFCGGFFSLLLGFHLGMMWLTPSFSENKYCVEFGRPGIESIPDGELWPATYTTAVTDPQAVGIIMNGFPFKTPDELGLGSVLPEHKEMMAYYATQTALWSHLQGWNPMTTWEATPDTEMVKTAMLQIYNAGWSNPVNQNVTVTATPTSPTAVEDGEYLVQTYSVNAAVSYASYTVALPTSAPYPPPHRYMPDGAAHRQHHRAHRAQSGNHRRAPSRWPRFGGHVGHPHNKDAGKCSRRLRQRQRRFR